MEILILLLLLGAIKCWIEWNHEKEQIRIAERARERFLHRRALESRGFTVVTDATSGEIVSYFKSGQVNEGSNDTPVVG